MNNAEGQISIAAAELPDVTAIAIYHSVLFNTYGIQFFNTFWRWQTFSPIKSANLLLRQMRQVNIVQNLLIKETNFIKALYITQVTSAILSSMVFPASLNALNKPFPLIKVGQKLFVCFVRVVFFLKSWTRSSTIVIYNTHYLFSIHDVLKVLLN